jgi:hypothetical protein
MHGTYRLTLIWMIMQQRMMVTVRVRITVDYQASHIVLLQFHHKLTFPIQRERVIPKY